MTLSVPFVSMPSDVARKGALLMLLAGALFALVNSVTQYLGMVSGISSPTIAFWQYLVALLVILPGQRRAPLPARGQLGLHLLRVGLAVVGVQLWVAGLAFVPIWQAIALLMLSPFFVTLGAWLLLGEQIGMARIGALLVGFVGGAVILAPWSDGFTYHALLPVAAAAAWAGTSLATKHLSHTNPAQSLTFMLLILLTPANALLAVGTGFALPDGFALGLLLLSGLLVAAAQYVLVRAYETADAAYLQPFDHLKLPLNIGLGILVFGYWPPGSLWLGAVMIVGASLWLMRNESS